MSLFRGSFATWLDDCAWCAHITLLSFSHLLFSGYISVFSFVSFPAHNTHSVVLQVKVSTSFFTAQIM